MNPCNKHHDQYHTECDAGYSCYLCRIAELETEIERLRAVYETTKETELKQVRELHTIWKAISIAITHIRNHRWESALAELEALREDENGD